MLDEASLVLFGNWFLVPYIQKLGQCNQGIWSICDLLCELFLESSLWWFHSDLFDLCTWLGPSTPSWIPRMQMFSILLATLVIIPQSNSLKTVLVIDLFSVIPFSLSCVLASDSNHFFTFSLYVPVSFIPQWGQFTPAFPWISHGVAHSSGGEPLHGGTQLAQWRGKLWCCLSGEGTGVTWTMLS